MNAELLAQDVYCLYQPEAGTHPEFEVLFIHGLRSSVGDGLQWRPTWSTRGGEEVECWPETWVPAVFPKARVLALSYNSSARNGESKPTALWESAINSVKTLLSPDVDFGKRPFFLVGHSMGGLLAKELLLRADASDRGREIVEHCKGLVFYGVPHLGAQAANFVTMINTATFGVPGVSRLVTEELRLLGESCYQRNLNFRAYESTIPALNFAELRKTLCGKILWLWPVKVMVVPKEIALYNGSGDNVSFIDADHHEVCRPSLQTDRIFAYFKIFIVEKLSAGGHPCTVNLR